MIEIVEHPTFRAEDFDASRKKLGVSAILCLRDEEDYLKLALNSIRPFFDEFVIVYNQCTDRTPEIVETFAREEPQRVRAFHYLPEVFPPRTTMHAATPPSHVSSFVYYFNFALSKVSYRVCRMWAGDMIAAPEPLARIMERLRSVKPWTLDWWRSPWKMGWWWMSGVNLWDHDGRVFVPKTNPRAYGKKDHGFWPIGRRNIFRHHSRVEYLRARLFIKTFVGFAYFHVKGMKKDRGIGLYHEENTNPLYLKRLKECWTNPELITFEEYCQIEPAARRLPEPASWGIRPVRR